MSTALENLMANAGQNRMLGGDGVFKNANYWKLWLDSQKAINPDFGAVVDTGTKLIDGGYSSSNDSFTSNVPSKPASEAQSYYDYWKDDGVSGRDLAQWGGLLTGAPISTVTDFTMGKNPAGNIGSMIGSTVLGNQAGSLEEYIALSNVGGMGGQWAGEQLAPGQWMGYNPGKTTAEALGFKQGSKMFDSTRDISMDIISEKVKQGMTVDEAVAEFDKEAKENQTYAGPVQVVEKSTGYGMKSPGESLATDNRGVISEVEPTTVSDFAGMFSSTIDGVGDWFSNAYDGVTGSFTGMQQAAPSTYTQQMSSDYGAESDPYGKGYESFGSEGDSTSRDESGAVFHSSDYNWGSTDGGASDVSAGTDFSPSE